MTNPQLYKKKPLPVMAYLWDGAAFCAIARAARNGSHASYELP
jgi:hypothetical protein